jgi:hypothetical protein
MNAFERKRISIRSSADAWSGIFFAVLGAAAFIFTILKYRLGTPSNMGPGYFPAMVGAVIFLLGLAIFVSSLERVTEAAAPAAKDKSGSGIAALVTVLAAVFAFALLLRPLGLIVSIWVMVVIARLVRMGSWIELLALAITLSAIGYLIFVLGLDMPFRLVPW